MKPHHIQYRPSPPETTINPVFIMYWPVPLVLLLCSCTLAFSKNNSTPLTETPCAADAISSAKTNTPSPTHSKLVLQKNTYSLDSERKHKLYLASMHNGSIYQVNASHDEARQYIFFKSKTLEDTRHSKNIVPWSRFQFELNDRWQLGADLPELEKVTSSDGNGNFAPVPSLTYDFGSVKLKSLFTPHTQDHTLISIMGIYLAITF